MSFYMRLLPPQHPSPPPPPQTPSNPAPPSGLSDGKWRVGVVNVIETLK